MKREIVNGIGPQMVELATGADVVISATGPVHVLVDSIVQRRTSFRLPETVCELELLCDSDVKWSLRWFVPKPGYELPDPTPIALPSGAYHPESLNDTIARMVRYQVSQAAELGGFDPEEDEDFEDDDDDVPTPYEFEERAAIEESKQRRKRELRAWLKEKRSRAKSTLPTTPAEPADSQAPQVVTTPTAAKPA